jgi:hypothetical protein
MEAITRRSALALGVASAATLPVLCTATPASAERYRPDEGKEIAPGVRRIDLSKQGRRAIRAKSDDFNVI